MLQSELDRQREEINFLAEKYGGGREALMPVLQEVQRKYSYISSYAMQVIADTLGIHPVEVYSVVSFYSFLHHEKQGKFVIRLCDTISCDMAGKDRVARQLEAELGIRFGETTENGRFTLEWAPCMGMCDQGPAMLVNDDMYTQVTPRMVLEIIEDCRSKFGVYAMQEDDGHEH
jgi:[NiFe] hydrogenase diaphorase moiety large subunit